MIRVFRILVRGLTAAFILFLAASGLAYYFASHSLPDYNAEYELKSLESPVEIVRDNYAVPHIFAQNDKGVLFGLGFVHAQDRLWQMTLMRRTVQGRLSEIFGEETLEIDVLMRTLDLYGIAVSAAQKQTPEVITELEAYSAGVNAYLELVRDEALGRGAPEFFLFSPAIAPWTPADSIAIQKLMAFQLTDMASREVRRAQLSVRLSPERLNDLLPQPNGAVISLPGYAEATGIRDFALNDAAPAFSHPLYPVPDIGMSGASNAWAAAGKRTAAGAPLLAMDPHLGLTAPSIWMLARLELASGGVIGGTIPGLPAILVGRNAHLGWGLTAAYLDDQDIFIERTDPENQNRYLTPEGSAEFISRDTVIAIKDAPAQTRKLRWTRHGPVIPAPHYQISEILQEGDVAALSWTALTDDDRTIEAMLKTMRSHSIIEAIEVGKLVVAPAQNIILADGETVGQKALGRAPRRDPGNLSQGQMPAAGWIAVNDWDGYLPYDSNPGAVNPVGGIVVNTNNKTTDRPFPDHWSFDWGDTHRIQRAQRLLNGREFHTLDSFIDFQTDTVSPVARSLLPLIARNLWFQGEPAASDSIERLRQTVLEALANWNGEMSEHSFEPLVYAAWVKELQRRLIIDDIGPLATRFKTPVPLFIERVFRDTDGASAWCDIKQSDRVETCEDVARISLDATILQLREQYGARLASWRWGTAHQAQHRHTALGRLGGLGWLVNITQETPGGDFTLLRGQSSGSGAEPFRNIHGSGFRAVINFADPDSSVFIISTGQSGHFLSRHYDDQSILWRRGEYIPMSLDRELAQGGAVGVTHLLPAQSQ